MRVPASILRAFPIGRVKKTTLLTDGLIHATVRVESEAGTFILQRLHPLLASKEIAADFLAVTEHLHAEGFSAPRCVKTHTGRVLAKDGKTVWRMQTAFPGRTVQVMQTVGQAREAGRIYAALHTALTTIPYRFQSTLVLHKTPQVLAAFRSAVRAHRSSAVYDDAQKEIEFVLHELPSLLLPKDLPRRVIHGDPKISNILFDHRGRASTVVDLDTCNRHTILVELGDAFRSWCGVREDDPKNRFRLPLFRAAWTAYKHEASFLTARERALVPQAISCITLELAARFLTDYFTDSYFGWDSKRYPSRRAHNLARARGQIALYKDLKRRKTELENAL